MVPKIKHNIIADFLFSIIRILDEKEYINNDFVKEYKSNKDIAEFILNYKQNASPILKRDMEYYCGGFNSGLFIMLIYAVDQGIEEVPLFLQTLNEMSGEAFKELIIRELELEIPDNLMDKETKTLLEKQLTKEFDFTNNVNIYIDYFNYPEDMKQRLVDTLHDYYNKFFKPVEGKLIEFIHKRIEEHTYIMEKDYKKFLENVVVLLNKEQVKGKTTVFYMNYFLEVRCCQYVSDDIYTIYYGYGLEQRLNAEFKRIQYKDLINVLSDEHRFNIIKLLGKRAWYSKELADHFGITTATMSYHIKKITALGIIEIDSGKNKRMYYKLNKEKFQGIINLMVSDIIND